MSVLARECCHTTTETRASNANAIATALTLDLLILFSTIRTLKPHVANGKPDLGRWEQIFCKRVLVTIIAE
jgi:hypothetical protein